jgi:hypothetical protein
MAGKRGGRRPGAGRPWGSKTDHVALVRKRALEILARHLALPLDEQDKRAIRQATEVLSALRFVPQPVAEKPPHEMTDAELYRSMGYKRGHVPTDAELERMIQGKKGNTVVRVPAVVSAEQWDELYCKPSAVADEAPSNPELAAALEARAAPKSKPVEPPARRLLPDFGYEQPPLAGFALSEDPALQMGGRGRGAPTEIDPEFFRQARRRYSN